MTFLTFLTEVLVTVVHVTPDLLAQDKQEQSFKLLLSTKFGLVRMTIVGLIQQWKLFPVTEIRTQA